jgi:hypothetical protein
MADAKVLTVDRREQIDRFHFMVGLVVLTAAALFSAFAVQFLFLR